MMTGDEFSAAQRKFAQRLRRLMQLPIQAKGGDFRIDAVVEAIESLVDGSEVLTGLIVDRIRREDRRLRENMVALRHVLANIPTEPLFGTTFGSDHQRVRRYEVIGALMVMSGFPTMLLDDGKRFEKWRFAPSSKFFQQRELNQLNEQFISCWSRRLLCFYGEVTNIRVPGNELRDKLAGQNAGMTTEQLLRKELGAGPLSDLEFLDL